MKTRRMKKVIKIVTFKSNLEVTNTKMPTADPEVFTCPSCHKDYMRWCYFEKHVASCKIEEVTTTISTPAADTGPKDNSELQPTRKPLRGFSVLLFAILLVLAGFNYLFLTSVGDASRTYQLLESESELYCNI